MQFTSNGTRYYIYVFDVNSLDSFVVLVRYFEEGSDQLPHDNQFSIF